MWPDCWPAFELLEYLQTQWRTSMAGPVGLDYSVFMQVMGLRGLDADEQLALLDDLRVLERAALNEIHKTF